MAVTLERIDDPDDPRVAAYRNIRERDLIGRGGRFVAEGKVVLRVLLTSRRFDLESILLLENRVAHLADLLALVPENVPVYVAAAPVIDAVAGFPLHRGVLAIGLRGVRATPQALIAGLADTAIVVALAGISNHDNMGAIFRNAAAFGAAAVFLDETCCDPLYRKSIRVSVGAALKVPFATGGSAIACADLLADAGFDVLALSPRGALELDEVSPRGRLALMLGSEGDGLPEKLLRRLTTVRIPIAEDFDSLNVATAAAITLYRWRRIT